MVSYFLFTCIISQLLEIFLEIFRLQQVVGKKSLKCWCTKLRMRLQNVFIIFCIVCLLYNQRCFCDDKIIHTYHFRFSHIEKNHSSMPSPIMFDLLPFPINQEQKVVKSPQFICVMLSIDEFFPLFVLTCQHFHNMFF